jgi:hypothetical protein
MMVRRSKSTFEKETLSSAQGKGSKSTFDVSLSGRSKVSRLFFERMVKNSCKSCSMVANS